MATLTTPSDTFDLVHTWPFTRRLGQHVQCSGRARAKRPQHLSGQQHGAKNNCCAVTVLSHHQSAKSSEELYRVWAGLAYGPGAKSKGREKGQKRSPWCQDAQGTVVRVLGDVRYRTQVGGFNLRKHFLHFDVA